MKQKLDGPLHAGSVITTAVFATFFIFACKESSPPNATPDLATPMMGSVVDKPAPMKLDGAGATFPYPVYAKWAHTYNKIQGTEINYQSIGSGGGIAQVKAKTVDFGASDAPLKQDELEAEGLIQFPMVIGGVVPVVHLDGIESGQLKLNATLLTDIFLGNISKWNDPAIKKINPALPLPDREIVVVHRADGSGTTWIFTNYLEKVSSKWKEMVGSGRAVKWPRGMGGKGNEGVASYVQRVKGAIGYVEFAYALQNKMTHVALQNRAGAFVEPTVDAFRAAAESADWNNAPGFFMVLTDQDGERSWPITGASFILIHKAQSDRSKALELLKFFDFCYNKGKNDAQALHYVSMPPNVIGMIHDLWKTALRVDGTPIWN